MNRKTLYSYCRRYINTIQNRWLSIIDTPHAKNVIKWFRVFFVTAILGYMIYQFFRIGWVNLWNSLPGKPIFYILYLSLFFMLPFSELFIYRIMWPVSIRKLFPALLVKKVYNSEVLGYSGEVFLFGWGKKELRKKDSEIIRNIKDNNVISMIVSTLFTIFVLVIFFETNPTIFSTWFQKIPANQIYYVLVSVIIIAALAIKFKRYIISLSLFTSIEIFAIHFLRHVLLIGIQIYQWHIILPEVSYHVWFTYIVTQIVLAMLPFVPNKDLLFITISMSMSTALEVPLAAIAAILLVNSVLERILNVGFYSCYQFLIPKKSVFADLQSSGIGSLTKTGIPSDIKVMP